MENGIKHIMLRKEHMMLLIIIISVLLILSGYIYYQCEKKRIRTEKYDELRAIAELKTGQLVLWQKERLRDANIILHRKFFRTNIEDFLTRKNDTALKSDILNQMSYIQEQSGYENIIVTTYEGEIILSFVPIANSLDSIALTYLKKVEVTRKTLLTDFYRDSHNNIYIDVIAPLTNNKGGMFAAIVLRVDPADYLYPLIQTWNTPSKTAETLILRREKEDILFLNELRHRENTALNLKIPLNNTEIVGVKAALGEVGISEGLDYRSEKVIADIRPVPGTPWHIVTKIDKSEIFYELHIRLVIIIAFVSLLIILSGVGLGWMYNQRQQLTTIQDLKARMKAEEALRYHQELLSEMGRVAKIGGWEFDPETGKGTWTEEVARIHDLDPNDETNMEKGLSFYQGKSRKLIEDAIKEAIETEKDYNLELELISAKGAHKWVQTIGHPVVENNKVVRIRGSFQDITERKKTEINEKLASEVLDILNNTKDSQIMISAIIQAIKKSTGLEAIGVRLKDGEDFPYYQTAGFNKEFIEAENHLCSYDTDGSIIRNEKGEPLLECMCGNILSGRIDIAKSFFTEGGSFRSNNTSHLLATTSPAERLARTRNRCNGAGYESVALIPIRSGHETLGLLQLNDHRINFFTQEMIPFFEGLAANIGIALTRNEAEAKIKKMNEALEERIKERTFQLEAANKELETFTYSVSHDLKAPLRGIDGYSKLLKEQYSKKLNDEAQFFISSIRESTLQMNQLIEDLLAYSRLERSSMQSTTIKIKKLLATILQPYSKEITERKVVLNVTVPDIEIIADTKGLTIALRNVIENALKFTKSAATPKIDIGLEENEAFWTFLVKDNGIGFDMKYHNRIFEIFQRLQRIEDYPGTGIGLAMVSKAMQRMGGNVRAESEPGNSTTFRLSIPKNGII